MRCIIKAALIVALFFSASQTYAKDNKALVKQHEKIMQQFTDVSHISTEDLASLPPEEVIIFDVRKRAEYDVSHMKGAVRVDPNISKETFLATYEDITSGKIAVFYCSVGVRSSILVDMVKTELAQRGVKAAYNLEGGLFKWHNEGRPIETVSEKTGLGTATLYIHPYNRFWGRMVNDKSLTRYKKENP